MYRINTENGGLKLTFEVFIRLKTQSKEVSFEKMLSDMILFCFEK